MLFLASNIVFLYKKSWILGNLYKAINNGMYIKMPKDDISTSISSNKTNYTLQVQVRPIWGVVLPDYRTMREN